MLPHPFLWRESDKFLTDNIKNFRTLTGRVFAETEFIFGKVQVLHEGESRKRV